MQAPNALRCLAAPSSNSPHGTPDQNVSNTDKLGDAIVEARCTREDSSVSPLPTPVDSSASPYPCEVFGFCFAV
jgi:hypothetical protein